MLSICRDFGAGSAVWDSVIEQLHWTYETVMRSLVYHMAFISRIHKTACCNPGRRGGIRSEGSDNGWRGQEMPDVTGYKKSKGLWQNLRHLRPVVAFLAALSIGHAWSEAGERGVMALVNTGDMIDIDIPNRTISLLFDDAVLATRRSAIEASGFKPNEKAQAQCHECAEGVRGTDWE